MHRSVEWHAETTVFDAALWHLGSDRRWTFEIPQTGEELVHSPQCVVVGALVGAIEVEEPVFVSLVTDEFTAVAACVIAAANASSCA